MTEMIDGKDDDVRFRQTQVLDPSQIQIIAPSRHGAANADGSFSSNGESIPPSPAATRLSFPAQSLQSHPFLSFVLVPITGLALGAMLCFSNMYFGLQTGWVTMGSMPAALLGYGLLARHPLFTASENVVLQTIAVATATMPLAAGQLSRRE